VAGVSAGGAQWPLEARWLSERLRARGLLEAGAVEHIARAQHGARGGTSENFALDIGYSADAAGACPRRLFCKVTRPERPQDAREAVFYREIAPRMPQPVSPVCVAAEHDAASGRVLLLLEDLGVSHRAAAPEASAPGSPPEDVALTLEVLARLHGCWWQDRALAARFPSLRPVPALELDAARCRQAAAGFADSLPGGVRDGLDAELMAHALDGAHARMAARVREARSVTLLHNDAHPGNVLLPRMAAQNGARLVDWSACTLGLATVDAAYALLWLGGEGAAPAAAAPLLERYRARLGPEYSEAELGADMRLAVELQLLRPLRMFANGAPPRWCAEVLRRALFMASEWEVEG